MEGVGVEREEGEEVEERVGFEDGGDGFVLGARKAEVSEEGREVMVREGGRAYWKMDLNVLVEGSG